MISLQYIAIVRLDPHVFWLPQEKKKKKDNCFEVLCSIYA